MLIASILSIILYFKINVIKRLTEYLAFVMFTKQMWLELLEKMPEFNEVNDWVKSPMN